jgi:hypothetical protein
MIHFRAVIGGKYAGKAAITPILLSTISYLYVRSASGFARAISIFFFYNNVWK